MISLLALILVLCIFEGGSILCDASSISNSQLRRRNVVSKSIVADKMKREVIDIQVEGESLIIPQPAAHPTPQPAGLFDLLVSSVFACLPEYFSEIQIPEDDNKPLKLATCTISGDEAVLLAPSLFENLEMMESRLKRIQINEVIVAAIKIKSLIPKMSVKVLQNSGKFSIDESSDIAVSATTFHVFNSIDLLIKTLPEEHQNQFDVSKQVFGFDFEGSKTLDEFINEKESEIALNLLKNVPLKFHVSKNCFTVLRPL